MKRLVLAAWLLPGFAGSASLLEQGVMQRGQGRFDESILSIQGQLKAEPDNARAWYELGLSYAKGGQYGKAVDAYRLALSRGLQEPHCHCNLGLALREGQRTEAALTEVRRCLELLPGYGGAWNLLGNIYTDRGQLGDALDAYQRAVTLSPLYANAHFNLGLTLDGLGRHSDAELSIREAIRLQPSMLLAWTALGDCQLSQSRAVDALKSYEQALRLSPQETQAEWGLARAWRRLGKFKKAAKHERAYKRLLRDQDKRAAIAKGARPARQAALEMEAWGDKEMRERN